MTFIRKPAAISTIVILLIMLILLSVALLVQRFDSRMQGEAYRPGKVYMTKASVTSAFDISYITREWVTLEGGTYGGIIIDRSVKDMTDLVPDMRGYDPDTMAILWVYEYKPKYLVTEKSLIGDKWLRIIGHSHHDYMISWMAIPKSFVTTTGDIICIPDGPEP